MYYSTLTKNFEYICFNGVQKKSRPIRGTTIYNPLKHFPCNFTIYKIFYCGTYLLWHGVYSPNQQKQTTDPDNIELAKVEDIRNKQIYQNVIT